MPWALHMIALGGFVLFDVAIAVCLITLAAVTASNDGFVTIGSQTQRYWSIAWNLEFLWTSLPVLVFRLLAIYQDWITASVAQRQPYVDVRKDGGATAQTTILLDYLAIPMLWRWWKAFANKHLVVGSCSLLTLIMSIVISALAANLFVVKTVPVTTTGGLLVTTGFNDSSMNLTVNWVPVFDTVSATVIHNGSPIAWTDEHYAFQPYEVQEKSRSSAEVTAKLDAYSAELSCSILEDFRLDVQDPSLFVEAEDRGCAISHQFEVSERQEVYLEMLSVNDCSANFSRLVVVAAMYSGVSSTLVSNLTVMSCIPSYTVTSGSLLADAREGSIVVRQFVPESARSARPVYWRTFEQDILASETYNYKTVWSTSAFGNLILYNAQAQDPRSYLAPKVLQAAVQRTFTAVYLTAAAKHAFVPIDVPILLPGTFVAFVQRLHSVTWTTYLILVILGIDLAAILVAAFYVYSRASILTAEPAGLLAYARILEGSTLLQDIRSAQPGQGRHCTRSAKGLSVQHEKSSVEETMYEDGNRFSQAGVVDPEGMSRWGVTARPAGDGWMIKKIE